MPTSVAGNRGAMSPSNPFLAVSDLAVRYGQAVAVSACTLRVERGQIVALLGVNGAGKTTTLNAIMGACRPASGQITLDGADVTRLAPKQMVARGVACSPEGRHVFPFLSVLENLEVGGHTLGKAERRRGIEQALELFPRLAERQQQLAGSLSGGEQQMLAMARALVPAPKLLLLDEPSLGLSPKMVHYLAGVISDIRDRGVAVLLVEQNAQMGLGVADWAYVLESGVVTMSGSATELKNHGYVQEVYFGTSRR